MYPSMTISACAGTSRSTLTHCTRSTGSPRRKPASISSSTCFGSGALAEYAVIGSRPSATATGIRPSLASQSARPSLWICQCMNVVARSITCMRYMPTLRVPSRGSRVITAGSVMNGAGSPGQQRWTGSSPRSTSSPRRTISWHVPLRTVCGSESAIDLSFCSPRTFSTRPVGGCISSTSATLRATSSSRSTPNARHMRRSLPNWLMSSECCEPCGRSNSSAGPPDFTVRSTISVISRSGSTSTVMRASSPSRSSSAIQSRRSRIATRRVYSCEVPLDLLDQFLVEADQALDEIEAQVQVLLAMRERLRPFGRLGDPRAHVVEVLSQPCKALADGVLADEVGGEQADERIALERREPHRSPRPRTEGIQPLFGQRVDRALPCPPRRLARLEVAELREALRLDVVLALAGPGEEAAPAGDTEQVVGTGSASPHEGEHLVREEGELVAA